MIRKDQMAIFVGVAVAGPVEVNILPFLTRTTIGPEHHWPSIYGQNTAVTKEVSKLCNNIALAGKPMLKLETIINTSLLFLP